MTKVQFPDSYAGALSQCSLNHPTPAAAAAGGVLVPGSPGSPSPLSFFMVWAKYSSVLENNAMGLRYSFQMEAEVSLHK